jgi:hypothetical protein
MNLRTAYAAQYVESMQNWMVKVAPEASGHYQERFGAAAFSNSRMVLEVLVQPST